MGLKKPKVGVDDAAENEETEVAAENEETEATSEKSAKSGGKKSSQASTASNVTVIPNARVAQMSGGGKFEDQMAEDGFEGLEVGFYSYTTVKLVNEGRFETAEGAELGKSLKVQLMESKRKFAYTNSEDENAAEFSYDRVHNTKGEQLDPILREWEEEGAKVTEKKYLDVTAAVLEGELEGEIVILSVSPSGVAKFTGYAGKLSYSGKGLRDVVTEVYVGAKITSVPKPFYPWGFRLVKD